MQDQVQVVLDRIEASRDAIIGFLADLVRTRSVNPAFDPDSPGEGEVARILADRYRALGARVELIEAAPGRPNVVATVPGTTGSPRLLVNCHTDTHAPQVGEWVDPYTGAKVPEWSADPFGAEIRGGRMYGRGTCDHKSPIAAIVAALEALKLAGVRLRGDIVCIHDADEETGGAYGMRYLADRRPFDFDMALYACTTDFTPLGRQFFTAMGENNIIRSTSGWHTYLLRVHGHNYHSLTPRHAHGAAEAALLLIGRLRPLMERVNAFVDPLEGRGQPPMRVTHITCNPRSATHHQARWCEVGVVRRLPPAVDAEAARAEMEALVADYNRDHPDNPAELEVVVDKPASVVPEAHPLVQGLRRAVVRVTGREPNIAGLPSPVGISTLLARHKIPTVLFGYGLVNLHHAVDEHIALDDVIRTTQVYAVALMEWLGVDA